MRQQRRIEIDTHHRIVDLADCAAPVHLETGEIVAAAEPTNAPAGFRSKQSGPFASRSIQVLIELNPDKPKRVWRIVGVANAHCAAECSGSRVERCDDGVIGALLPIVGTGTTSAVSNRIRSWPFVAVDAPKRIVDHRADRACDCRDRRGRRGRGVNGVPQSHGHHNRRSVHLTSGGGHE